MKRSGFDLNSKGTKKIRTLPVGLALKLEKQRTAGESLDLFDDTLLSLPNNTEITLQDFRRKFPKENIKFPPIIFVHQLYHQTISNSVVLNEIGKLEDDGKIRRFDLGKNLGIALVFNEDLVECLDKFYSPSTRVKIFLENVLPGLHDTHVSKTKLKTYKDIDITELIRFGMIINKSETYYSLSFPGLGAFAKTFLEGRQELLRVLKRARYKELLVSELKTMRFKKLLLDIDYHIADVIGADLVVCKSTTSGQLLQHKNI